MKLFFSLSALVLASTVSVEGQPRPNLRAVQQGHGGAAAWQEEELTEPRQDAQASSSSSNQITCTALISVAAAPAVPLNDANSYRQGIPPSPLVLACQWPHSSGVLYQIQPPIDMSPTGFQQWMQRALHQGTLRSGVTTMTFDANDVDTDAFEIRPSTFPPPMSLVNHHHDTTTTTPMSSPTTTGTKTVLWVRVQSTHHGETTVSAADVARHAFSTQHHAWTGQEDVSLKSQIFACSQERLLLNPASVGTDGVVTVMVKEDDDPSSAWQFHNRVTQAVQDQFQVSSPTDLADFVVYCLPPQVLPSSTGYAMVNSWLSVQDDAQCLYLSPQMQLLGYNMGLGPAHDATHYQDDFVVPHGDQTGMMGYTYQQIDTPKMCYNAAQLFSLQWYASDVGTWTQDTKAGSLILHGFVKKAAGGPSSQTFPKLIQFERSSQRDLYMVLNWQGSTTTGSSSPNDETQEAVNQVTLVEERADGRGFAPSVLRAKLGVGERFVMPEYFDNGCPLDIRIEEINIVQGHAKIRIESCPASTDTAVTPPHLPRSECNDNGRCEAFENCYNCPSDCRGHMKGNDFGRFCCDGGPLVEGEYHIAACDDARCGYEC